MELSSTDRGGRSLLKELWTSDRLFVLLYVALTTFAVAMFWFVRYLPLQDLPQHLALNAVFTYAGKSAYNVSTYYSFEWTALPYLLFRSVNGLLGRIFSVDIAIRILLSLYAIALPLSVLLLARLRGRNPWPVLLVFAFIFSKNLHYGFISFAISAALYLFALVDLERSLSRPSGGRSGRIGLWTLLFLLTHAQTFLVWIGTLGLFCLLDRRLSVKRVLLALGPNLLLFAGWVYVYLIKSSTLDIGTKSSSWWSVAQSLSRLHRVTFLNFKPFPLFQQWWFYGMVATLIGLTIAVSPRRFREAGVPLLAGLRYEILLMSLIGLYFALPFYIGGQWFVSPRPLLLAALLFPCCIRQTFKNRPAAMLARSVIVVLAVTYLSVTAWCWTRFDSEVGRFDRAVASIPRGKRMLPLIFRKSSRLMHLGWIYAHFGGYVVASKGGAMPTTWRISGAVLRKPWSSRLKPHTDARRFRWRRDSRHYQYFLLRYPPVGKRHPFNNAPTRFQLVYSDRQWQVYRQNPAPDGSK